MARGNSAADLSTNGSFPLDSELTSAEKDVLRSLAGQVAELAARPVEEEKRRMWYSHNALQPTRPLVFCDPENGWNEIIPEKSLQCVSDLARQWEFNLRKEAWWGSRMNDDRVITGIFNLPRVYSESDWGVHEVKHGGENGGSYVWDAPIKDYNNDLSKLRYPVIDIDEEATALLVQTANELFGDLLKVREWNMWWWSLGLTQQAIGLRGLEQLMLDMYDEPEGLHALMAFLRDGYMARIDLLEENGLLPMNNAGDYVGSGGFGWTDELPQADFTGKVRAKDMWGFGESQETVSVHPEMFAEFVFPYQVPLMERFGLNCYGCCEPLHTRWHIVKKAPRLRRISISAWCDVAKMAAEVGGRQILSMKPNPAMLATPIFDGDAIRSELREKLEQARGCTVELIMKDNHTIANNPQHVIDWVQIAKEEAEKAAS